MKNLLFVVLIGLVTVGQVYAVPIGGIEFPDGPVSFADAVVSYSPGSDVGSGWNNPNDALGVPNFSGSSNATSLGEGGELILRFTDNSLTTSGDASEDLWIFEMGAATEWFNVAISEDNVLYIDLGDVLGQPTGIDIDAIPGVVAGNRYSYVRLRDIPPDQTSFPYGEADIDAVGAISSAPPASIPEPTTLVLMGLGLAGIGYQRRRSKKAA